MGTRVALAPAQARSVLALKRGLAGGEGVHCRERRGGKDTRAASPGALRPGGALPMNPDAFVKRRFAFILGGMVAVSATFQASGVSQLIAHQITRDGEASAPPVTDPVEVPLSEDPPPSAAAILERNPFDSTTGPLVPPPSAAPAGPPDLSQLDPYLAPPCDTGRVVLIAMSEDPEWSFAAFESDGGHTALRRRGGEIGGRKVQDIAWDRVWMTSTSGARAARCSSEEGRRGR